MPGPDLSLLDTLTREHGYLIGGEDLRRLLAFPSPDSFKKALQRKSVPVSTFHVEGRRGRFARTADVAQWITDQLKQADHPDQTDQREKGDLTS